nr:hypothetical protein [Tanacetum cinerariifolium]
MASTPSFAATVSDENTYRKANIRVLEASILDNVMGSTNMPCGISLNNPNSFPPMWNDENVAASGVAMINEVTSPLPVTWSYVAEKTSAINMPSGSNEVNVVTIFGGLLTSLKDIDHLNKSIKVIGSRRGVVEWTGVGGNRTRVAGIAGVSGGRIVGIVRSGGMAEKHGKWRCRLAGKVESEQYFQIVGKIRSIVWHFYTFGPCGYLRTNTSSLLTTLASRQK